eukprot:g5308.t1
MNRPHEEGATSRSGGGGGIDYPNDSRPTLTTNDALLYLREVKLRFQHRKEVYDTFLDIMKDFKSQSIDIACVINKVKTLLRGHDDLILGFNTFLPKGSEITTEELRQEPVTSPPNLPNQIRPAVELDQAIAYINKIKTRFAEDSRVYKSFLEILCSFRQGRMDIKMVYQEVAELFLDHEDLLEEFRYFLPDGSEEAGVCGGEFFPLGGRPLGPLSSNSNDPYNDTRRRRIEANRRQRDFEWELSFFEEVKAKLNNRESYNDLLKCINLYAQDVISKSELVELVGDVIGRFPDVMATFCEFLASIPGDDEGSLSSRIGNRGGLVHYQRSRALVQQRSKYLSRPVSELDTSELDRPTTSYIRLPGDYPMMACSGKTALGREVLQDKVASVTTGTEDGSFKQFRKNQYEEALFRAEDERYDLELAIDRTRSTIDALLPIQEHIDSLTQDERATYTLPPMTLRSFHVRTIEKIYSEKGRTVCELLRKNPVVSVPVVLCRLQQKNEEWAGVLRTMNGHWQGVADTNFHKSLDHRSFYFKQQDKKTLAPKTLLQDLKEAAEAARTDQKLISLSSGVPVQSLFVPHLQFAFEDFEVHEDLFNIVRFAASKMLPPNVWRQSMEIWTEFIEPFFHLTPHALDVDLMELDTQEQETPIKEEDEIKEVDQMEEEEEIQPDPVQEEEEEESRKAPVQHADPSRAYQSCRPISTSLHPDGVNGVRGLDVFFCNEAFYLFLRYHQILYDRIKLARECCQEQVLLNDATDVTDVTVDHDTSEKRHGQFMSLVYALIDNSIDIAQFEDQCRSLLSTNSYVLFTLDRLIGRLMKQLQSLVFDEPSKQVWQLYKYESARGSPCHEGVYYANTKTVVREDYLVRAQSSASGQLSLTFVENSFVYDLPNGNAKFNHGDYSRVFLDSSGRKQIDCSKVYLARNKDLIIDEDLIRKGTLYNGLEIKISMEDHKLKFVEGTTDIWTAPVYRARLYNDKLTRKFAFQRWISGKLMEAPCVPESVEGLMGIDRGSL